ncbi:MAG TPA: restriction endonuclease subunit S [Pseudomonas sp.]|uniref:restriction endonuclease subunit S n=1 Tax=Pseudomonas sp. TaxID=306 RepID=UPI002B483700|nr:restriction endonuclease subunit S [Pseudomonas sp.]HKS13544.1 restriction endonuclease subunit S [Pseudomonas sp.]
MSAEVKPGFKQTEVGVLPVDWEAKKLGEVASFRTGPFGSALHKSDYTNDGIPVVNPMHILDGRIVPTTSMTITEEAAESLDEFRLSPGEVIIGRRGDMGRCAVVSEREKGWLCGTGSMIVRPFASVNAYFLQRVLSTPSVIKAIEDSSVGSTMINLNQGTLSSLVVQVPSVEEQRSVASSLADMDALIRKLDQLVTKKRDIHQAAMQQLLSGQRRLPGYSGNWEVRPLEEIAHIKTGSKNNQDKVESGDYPFFVRSANVERINSYSHDCEAILVPGEGGIGSIFHYVNGKFDVHQRVYAISQFVENVSGMYVYLYMSVRFGAHAMQNSVKATVDSLRLPTFQVFEVLLPPTKEEQTAIAQVLTDMSSELASLEARCAKVRQLKQGMMQELLTGRIRLV